MLRFLGRCRRRCAGATVRFAGAPGARWPAVCGLLLACRGNPEGQASGAPEGARARVTPPPATLAPAPPPVPSVTPEALAGIPPDSPWASREACRSALQQRRAPDGDRVQGRVRLGAWNVRWFPDGRPLSLEKPPADGGTPPPRQRTDVGWLACAIAWLGVDVMAMAEIKATPEAREASGRLTESLDLLTGGKWRLEVDPCPNANGQSLALLFDERRVHGRAFANAGGADSPEECRGALPAFGGYFRSSGGLDLHYVAVHLRSGPWASGHHTRAAFVRDLDAVRGRRRSAVRDDDVIFAGDFNTMGCRDCKPEVSTSGELAELERGLGELGVPARRVPAEPQCSQYYRGKAALLDHFVVPGEMAELGGDERVQVSGYCQAAACAELELANRLLAYQHLSDHCPVVLELPDRDLDGTAPRRSDAHGAPATSGSARRP